MSEQQVPINPELIEIEATLGGLVPSPSRLDRDRLMFQAGSKSNEHSLMKRWGWPSLSATLAVGLLGTATALVSRPESRVIETIVYVKELRPQSAPVVILKQEPETKPTTSPTQRSLTSGDRFDRRLLRFGSEALPEPTVPHLSEFASLNMTSHESGSLLRSEIARLLNPGESL